MKTPTAAVVGRFIDSKLSAFFDSGPGSTKQSNPVSGMQDHESVARPRKFLMTISTD